MNTKLRVQTKKLVPGSAVVCARKYGQFLHFGLVGWCSTGLDDFPEDPEESVKLLLGVAGKLCECVSGKLT